MANELTIPTANVAVALIFNSEQDLLWVWDDKWSCFTLPMTKIRGGQGIQEPARHAAIRAAAEAIGVPVRVEDSGHSLPEVAISERTYEVRHYQYTVFRIAAHAQFSNHAQWHLRRPHIWLSGHKALSGEFQPLSQSARQIVSEMIQSGDLPTRLRPTVTLVIKRTRNSGTEFLLRQNPYWGYTLPSKKRQPQETPVAAATRAAKDELGLVLAAGAASPATAADGQRTVEVFRTHGISMSENCPTSYEHLLLDITLPNNATFQSEQPLIWVTADEVAARFTTARTPATGTAAAPAGAISITTSQILTALDYLSFWSEEEESAP